MQAQNKFNYTEAWNKVDELVNKKGLITAALRQVATIYTRAKQEKNQPQLIKALVFQATLQSQKEEQADVKTIALFEREATQLQEPARSIMNSLLATSYWNYLQNNRWRFYQRTNTSGTYKKDDIATWTISDLHQAATNAFDRSLSNEPLLQQTKLDAFEPVLIKGNMRALRPTLFDLLAHRALDYFENDERTINQPEDLFQLNTPEVFGTTDAFVQWKVSSNNPASLHHRALLLFQKLAIIHKKNKVKDAIADVELRRISFAYRYATLDNKSDYYRKALVDLRATYRSSPVSAQAVYLLASYYAEQASQYDFRKHKELAQENPRWYYQTAAQLCREAIQENSNSEGAINCSNLLSDIERKNFSVTLEQVNLPAQPFRSLVTYRNMKQIWFRIVTTNQQPGAHPGDEFWDDEVWNRLISLQPLAAFTKELPFQTDHQEHAVELPMPALKTGTYLVLASADAAFSTADNILAAQYIHVSSLAWFNHRNHFFVVDRESGQPRSNATVHIWERNYNYNTRESQFKKTNTYRTDTNGSFQIQEMNHPEPNNKSLQVIDGNDTLFTNDQVYVYRNDVPATKAVTRMFLFSDRSIYRPGQTVYFKGIATTTEPATGKPTIINGLKTTVTLYDVNSQKVDSIQLVTNAFGAYSGTFILPQGKLNGLFRLQDASGGSLSISVEEYKRPKFYIGWQPITGTYEVNEEIQVQGYATSYAGSVINNAKLRYRVIRIPRLLYPWLCYRWGWPVITEKEIKHGDGVTAADGSFSIRFLAEADKQVQKELLPVFDYKIMTEVTDLNGETRTAETIISAGYTSLQLDLAAPSVDLSQQNTISKLRVTTQNLSGTFVATPVTIRIFQLDAPQRLIRQRYWQQPDTFVMSQSAYIQTFPYDEYNNETNQESWRRVRQVHEQTDSTRADGSFSLSTKTLPDGWYQVEATAKDKRGQDLIKTTYVQLTQNQNRQPAYIWQLPAVLDASPGTHINIEYGSSATDVFLVEEQTADSGTQFRFHSLSNEKKSAAVKVTEQHRGGFGYSYAFVKHNRLHSFFRQVNVPWTDKELQIRFETFRDKTLPGSKETWNIRIKGHKGEQVAAELLASAYDASLDQFKKHEWTKPQLFPIRTISTNWSAGGFTDTRLITQDLQQTAWKRFDKLYDNLIDVNGDLSDQPVMFAAAAGVEVRQKRSDIKGAPAVIAKEADSISNAESSDPGNQQPNKPALPNGPAPVRSNFAETAFFYPHLHTDSAGNVLLQFTMPEALTRWKTQVLAHTKDLATGMLMAETVTQKELMVQSFAPRFLREGDRCLLTAKITNLTTQELSGTSELRFFNASTGQPVDAWFQNLIPVQYFTVAAGMSTVVTFRTEVPFQFNEAVVCRFIATSGSHSDGEEITLPVLTNRTLVTETLPLPVRDTGSRNFSFTKLRNNASPTLQHHRFTVEFSTNPVWYAVQALPFLMEYPYACAEQTWNRFYANSLATYITNKIPRIRSVLDQWKTKDTAAFLSNLQKNEALKQVLLQETPWVLQAASEADQKRNISLLFDMVRMSRETGEALAQLAEMQSPNGGFVWFKGGPDDRYITQYIVTGIGHLQKLGAWPPAAKEQLTGMLSKALVYLDRRIQEDYHQLRKRKAKLSSNQLSAIQVQYLYMRSFFSSVPLTPGTTTAYNYYLQQGNRYWLQQQLYIQAMLALTLHRNGQTAAARNILASIRQRALVDEETGMYWKAFTNGFYWHQSPVAAQALMVELFAELTQDAKTITALQTWLLKQKQTSHWTTTIATAEACYALLMQQTDMLASENIVTITAGRQVFSTASESTEAGTGYFQRSMDGSMVTPQLGDIQVTVSKKTKAPNQSATLAWGAAYWQYFEDLDKITAAATPLQLQKDYLISKNTSNGPVLQPIEDGASLRVGDRVIVRIVLRSDRYMEYVHMKDVRASCMEPADVLSSYKWQDGLGYYQVTKDAATHFFFSQLPKGTYVFEYPVYITHAGTFSAGITSIQCMYAPEFTSHSNGVKVKVED